MVANIDPIIEEPTDDGDRWDGLSIWDGYTDGEQAAAMARIMADINRAWEERAK